MSSQILEASKRGQKYSFHFSFPKKGLCLRSAVIGEDGQPQLSFDTANCSELPTLTEEDVATVARVVSEGKRPEFFYKGFENPNHPLHNTGRLYKLYSPQYLRGTSIGDLLSEADWSMKCLHVGTRSNADKTEFWSWQKTSKLKGLAVHMDFPHGDTIGCVLMSCESVNTEQSDNEIVFTNEPKMKITDRSKPMYTKYITEHYDKIAFYDEPLFLKMQELIKLIVTVEWMKEKGVKFNKKWMKFHTQKQQRPESQAVDIMPNKDSDAFIERVGNLFDIPGLQELTASGPYGLVTMKAEKIKQTTTGLEVKVTKTCPALSLQQISIIRSSINDYDFLYEGFDYREPFTLDDDGKFVIPDVSSWSELFAETVPSPHTAALLQKEQVVAITHGGITTRDIPVSVKKMKNPTHSGRTVDVKGSRKISCQTEEITDIPKCKPIAQPSKYIPARTLESERNSESATHTSHGYMDRGRVSMHSDRFRVEANTMKTAANSSVTINGEVVDRSRSFQYAPATLNITPAINGSGLSGPLPLDSGTQQQHFLQSSMDTGTMDNGDDDGCSSPQPQDGGTDFNFVSPVGSGDEMN